MPTLISNFDAALACQIALWGLNKELADYRLLPVLIETELGDKELTEAIRDRLSALVGEVKEKEGVPLALLEKLLRHQRILVIVDHLSEMKLSPRRKINPEATDFPAKALMVTCRQLEEKDKDGSPLDADLIAARKTVLKAERMDGDHLHEFFSKYVRLRIEKAEDLQREAPQSEDIQKLLSLLKKWVDDDLEVARAELNRMAEGRTITVLAAKLYIDEMLEGQLKAGDIRPSSLPELMLRYLDRLNEKHKDKRDNTSVRRDAQIVAWECLKENEYKPGLIQKDKAIAALEYEKEESEKDEEKTARERLKYLEDIQLLQKIESGDRTGIILDPLAEYLAATYKVENLCSSENSLTAWEVFLEDVRESEESLAESLAGIQGFLRAMWDCSRDKNKELNKEEAIPDSVMSQLASMAGINREELEQIRKKRRVRKLILELSAPELPYRIRAAEDLGEMGTVAREAERHLIGMLENRSQEIEARQVAAQTLGKLGVGAEKLLALLNDPTDEIPLRRSAAEALGMMKAGQTELRQLLESNDQPLPIRQGAARALSLIGAPSGEPVPMLIVELKQGEPIAQVKSIPVWRERLTEDLTLDLVTVPAGKFLMGSPPDEDSRNWYWNNANYTDTQGKDVEQQHPVTLSPFSMSQYPITQAQWRFVAQELKKVNRALDPDPASVKGDRHPVETVSWYDAVEFCARLSKYTDKTYRLPSEAEWEYACRAGTTTPFHFGDTLSTDFANYNGNYTYGNGAKGIYRQKTIEVGCFGAVNAFGLSEMHGNVWEWCLDHWHPSYEGAPADGSAWVTEGNDRYRILRGGSWFNAPGNCRSANRLRNSPLNLNNNNGFRVVCVSPWTL